MSEAAVRPNRLVHATGVALSGLAVAFLVLDATMKVLALPVSVSTTAELGYPADPTFIRGLGLVLLACTALYAAPATSVLGAILLTAWMGGAVASHLRHGDPLFTHVLFGVYGGILVWAGLWLREPGLWALTPLRRQGG
jgi:hypothetical protein